MGRRETYKSLSQLRGKTSRSRVAEAIGITVQAIGNYERGDRFPSPLVMEKLASLYNVSVDHIFFACKDTKRVIKQKKGA